MICLISFQTASAQGILPCPPCGSLHRHHGHPVKSSWHGCGDAIPIFIFPLPSSPPRLMSFYGSKDLKSSTQTLSRNTLSSSGTTVSKTYCSSSLRCSLRPADTPRYLFLMDAGFHLLSTCMYLLSLVSKIEEKKLAWFSFLYAFSMVFSGSGILVTPTISSKDPKAWKTHSFHSDCRLHLSLPACFLMTCCP